MLDFVSLQADAWTMRFGSNDLTDTDPVTYWTSYITNPFIGLPDKTAHQWRLYKCCMKELFGMWITTASLERAFSMGKHLAPPQKSRLNISTTASHLLIKTHYKLYREKRERGPSSKRITVEFDCSGTLSNIVDELDIVDSSLEEINFNERDLRHELCKLKLWNPEGSSLLRFPSKLNKLVPHWVVQEKVVDSEFSNESSEPADLTYF
ncbi:hypothetical protein LOD99_14585 [Oopsacas minuta]|uniref:HAT C-terminal dimerisation domain-containing protein n=1 Tax=Oopsacas minuta TaxID=111878 RepID=A0AAV7KE92_9METZ|nr:hypothetical protein LOD99_14585 [Oopsacas minuta]